MREGVAERLLEREHRSTDLHHVGGPPEDVPVRGRAGIAHPRPVLRSQVADESGAAPPPDAHVFAGDIGVRQGKVAIRATPDEVESAFLGE